MQFEDLITKGDKSLIIDWITTPFTNLQLTNIGIFTMYAISGYMMIFSVNNAI
jgi:hypothetical protein